MNYKTIVLIVSILSALLMQGCGAAKKPQVHVKQKTLPNWYTKPPRSTEFTLYGVGEGSSKKEAVAQALADVVSKLNVSISSSFSAKSIVREGLYSSKDATYIDSTKSEVKKITISSYELVDSIKIGYQKYAALVEVDKAKFAKALQKEIEREFALIEEKKKSLHSMNALEQLRFYKSALLRLEGLQNKLAVASMLETAFNEQKYIQHYERIYSEYISLRKAITFWVYSKDRELTKPIKEGLAKEQFRLQKKRDAKHFDIYIDAHKERLHVYGVLLIRATVTITTKDYKGTTLATNVLELSGQSSESYDLAKQDLARELHQKVIEEGIYKILNLDI